MQISISTLKNIARAEGFSFLAFAVTMPLKYGLDILWPNKIIGWIHGLLFLIYWVCMLYSWPQYRWPFGRIFIILLASVIPLAPFWVERKLLRDPD